MQATVAHASIAVCSRQWSSIAVLLQHCWFLFRQNLDPTHILDPDQTQAAKDAQHALQTLSNTQKVCHPRPIPGKIHELVLSDDDPQTSLSPSFRAPFAFNPQHALVAHRVMHAREDTSGHACPKSNADWPTNPRLPRCRAAAPGRPQGPVASGSMAVKVMSPYTWPPTCSGCCAMAAWEASTWAAACWACW